MGTLHRLLPASCKIGSCALHSAAARGTASVVAQALRQQRSGARRGEQLTGETFRVESEAVPIRPEQAAYMPFGAAQSLMEYRGREVLLAGPAGTGKSRAALEKVSFVAYHVPIRAAIVRKVRKSLTQAALVSDFLTFRTMAARMGTW